MRLKLWVGIIWVIFLFVAVSIGEANIRNHMYTYDISQLDWQLLNWTSAWRGTTRLAEPFILDRMEFDRQDRKIIVYLDGTLEQATEENLKKSIQNITEVFRTKFPTFEPKEDLIVYYTLKSQDGNKVYKQYITGASVDKSLQQKEKPSGSYTYY